jgi:hypothetical protein
MTGRARNGGTAEGEWRARLGTGEQVVV